MERSATIIGSTTMASPMLLTGPPTVFTFGVVDYSVFILMLAVSAGIGVYFGFIHKHKNTTDEYLMGGKRMKTIPIAISLVASQLSGIAIMSIPAESYAYGYNYFYTTLSVFAVVPILCYVIVPVFYENKISNCYEYLEMRFNKLTRQIITGSFVLNSFLMLPIYTFIPSLAFSQVTGVNIHLINTLVCSICVFYTMLGGIKAVVWTDVIQAVVMIGSVLLVGILGTVKVGGLGQVLENASAGGRLDANFSWDPRIRLSVWNGLIGGLLMWTGHIGLNQSCVQRIVALPTLHKARKSLVISGVGFFIIMTFNCFIGIVMFAHYYGCDPILGGIVKKVDKLMPFFVQDILGHLTGMPGIFISCVFSASLSTMSATMNSVAGVVYFDCIKPFIKHTEARANAIMKMFVVCAGAYCILGGLVVQYFTSILQIVITITGINTGAVVGVFLLGMFVPRCNGKEAVVAVIASMACMVWIILSAQTKISAGIIRYTPLPTTIDRCENHTFSAFIANFKETSDTPVADLYFNNSTTPHSTISAAEEQKITTAFGSNRDFSITEISFYFYKLMGAIMVWAVAIPLSYIWKSNEEDKFNPLLYSPFVRKLLKRRHVEMEEMPLKMEKENLNNSKEDRATTPKHDVEMPQRPPLQENGHSSRIGERLDE